MTSLIITVTKTAPIAEVLNIIGETEKAYKVENRAERKSCFIPKSALIASNPGVETYENCFYLAPWFAKRLDYRQEQVLGIAN